jgi:hypothetical protein
MSFSVALLILAIGIAIGYKLPGPLARARDLYRRLTYKPETMRRYLPDEAPPKADGRKE